MNWLLRSSLTKSLMGSFLLILIPITGISIIGNYVGIVTIQRQVLQAIDDSLASLVYQLDDRVLQFESQAYAISDDRNIVALNYSQQDEREKLLEYRQLINQLNFFTSANELYSEITVLLYNQNVAISNQRGVKQINLYENTNLINHPTNRWFLNSRNSEGTPPVLSFIQSSEYAFDRQSVTVQLDIDLAQISVFLGALENQGGTPIFLLDTKKDIIYLSREYDLDFTLIQNNLSESAVLSDRFEYVENANTYWVTYHSLDRTGLVLGMILDQDQALQPIISLRKWIAASIAASILLAIFVTIMTYKTFLKPVGYLVDAMRAVRKGDLKTRLNTKLNNEISLVYDQFNRMVSQIETLIKEVYHEKIARQQAQLKFLQSQINPHFLYNCLYFIYLMAKDENLEGIEKFSIYLGKYFKFATRSNRDEVSLGEELESIEAYLNIQRMRFPERIIFSTQIDVKYKAFLIPRLLVQPIVENALVHGIEKTSRQSHLSIRVFRQENKLVIEVEDDCIIIDSLTMQKIESSLENPEKNNDDSSYGLANISLRLKLRYGENATIKSVRQEPRGLKIQFSIPYISNKNNNENQEGVKQHV